MHGAIYQFRFEGETPFQDIRDSLLVAIFAAEGIHGKARVQLEADVWVDEGERTCAIDAATSVGRTVAQVFTGLVQRLLGTDEFAVERVPEAPEAHAFHAAAAAQ